MSPGEVLSLILLSFVTLVVILVVAFILKRYKKTLGLIIFLLIVVFVSISYITYSPAMKINTHAKKYLQLITYLNERYPNQQFTIFPQQYESGHSVGQFSVNNVLTPQFGVELKVDRKGNVKQFSNWQHNEFYNQENLWEVLRFELIGSYTLDSSIPMVEKIDYWTDGDKLTVFAVNVDGSPAIAVFTYTLGGYGLLQFVEGKNDETITTEVDGYLISYVIHGEDKLEGKLSVVNIIR